MRRPWHVLTLILLALVPAGASAQAREALGAPRAPVAPSEAVLDAATHEAQGRALDAPRRAVPEALLGDFHLEVGVGTLFPVSVGASARLVHDTGFFVDVFGAGTPTAYADLAGEAAGAYSVNGGPRQLLVGLLDGAGMVRLSVGARPVAGTGFEVLGGYTVLLAMPSLPRTTVEAATGQSFSPAGDRIALSLVVHALHLELGYALVLFDHLVIRAAFGGTLAVGADFRVGVPDSMRPPGGPVQTIERDVSSSIPGRAFLPSVRLEAAARF